MTWLVQFLDDVYFLNTCISLFLDVLRMNSIFNDMLSYFSRSIEIESSFWIPWLVWFLDDILRMIYLFELLDEVVHE